MASNPTLKGLKQRPRDPDLYEVHERASWAHEMSTVAQFAHWLRNRLALASSWSEHLWLTQLLSRALSIIDLEFRQVINARRRLLSTVTVGCRRDVNDQLRREVLEEREIMKAFRNRESKSFKDKQLKAAEARWEEKRQALIAREEERRERERQGRWLISR